MIEEVKDYLTGLRQRWCIWHLAMTMLASCFFLETFIIFGELYWWKYTAKPGSIEGIVTDSEFNQARLYHLSALSAKFITKLIKYAWYTAMVGFGWIEGLWTTFSNLSCISRPLHAKGRSKTKAILGSVFFGIFLVLDRILIPIILIVAASLLLQVDPLPLLSAAVNPFTLVAPIVYAVILALLERKLPRGVYGIAIGVTCIFYLVLGVFSILIDRLTSQPVISSNSFSVKAEVIALCKQVGFDPNHAYLQEGGKNAFFTGFGPLSSFFLLSGILGQPKRQILAIAAHELGHWNWGHSLMSLLMIMLQSALTLVAFYVFRQRHWYRKFVDMHFDDPLDLPFGLSFTIFTIIYVPVEVIMGMLVNMISWSKEIAADNFAIGLGYGPDLILALAELGKDHVELSYRSPIYGLFYHSHPPLNVRFNLIRGGGMFQ